MFPFRLKRPDEALLRGDEIAMRRRQRYGAGVMRRLKMDRPLTDDEIHRRMRPRARRFWVGGTITLALLAYLLQSPLLGLCALLILSLGVVPEIWQRLVLRGVRFERGFAPARVSFGEPTRYVIQIENHKRLPVPWLEVEDEFAAELEMPGAPVYPSYKPDRQLFITTLALWSRQRVTRRYRVVPLARGVWNFGPTYLRAGDPFGFLDDERQITQRGGQHTLMVLPLVAPLERFGLPTRYPFGETETRRRFLEDPSQITGARDYVAGDPLRRMHWKATAHQGTLQSKVYPFTTDHTFAIFLDIYTMPSVNQGVVTALFELGIAAAASIAAWAHKERYALGLFSNGLPMASGEREMASLADAHAFMRVPPSTHPDQLGRVLESLARLQPYFGVPIDRLLAREQTKLAPGATVIVITSVAALQPSTVTRLERLQARGHTVALLLTGTDPVAAGKLLTYRLGGEDTWNELVAYAQSKRREDRSDALFTTGPTDGAAGTDAGGPASVAADSADSHRHEPAFALG